MIRNASEMKDEMRTSAPFGLPSSYPEMSRPNAGGNTLQRRKPINLSVGSSCSLTSLRSALDNDELIQSVGKEQDFLGLANLAIHLETTEVFRDNQTENLTKDQTR